MLAGFDPGSIVTGYGVIVIEEGRFKALEYGCIRTGKKTTLADKLEQIYQDVESVLREYQPEEVVVEKAFYHKNAQVSMILGHVRGVIMLAARLNKAHVVEMTPTAIKKMVTGNGSAGKDRVKYMATRLLGLKLPPESADAADALGMALAHALCTTRG